MRAESKNSVICIGDKGRAQLTRALPAQLTTTFQDTYKVRCAALLGRLAAHRPAFGDMRLHHHCHHHQHQQAAPAAASSRSRKN